jgi:hypothetical protein
MTILIEITNGDDELIFSETAISFEMAQEILGRAERYVNRKEVEADIAAEDNF